MLKGYFSKCGPGSLASESPQKLLKISDLVSLDYGVRVPRCEAQGY